MRALLLALALSSAPAQQPFPCHAPAQDTPAERDAYWQCIHAQLAADDADLAHIQYLAALARYDMSLGLCQVAWERTPWWRRAVHYRFRNPCTHAGGR